MFLLLTWFSVLFWSKDLNLSTFCVYLQNVQLSMMMLKIVFIVFMILIKQVECDKLIYSQLKTHWRRLWRIFFVMKLLKIKILIPAQTCCWSPTHTPSTAPGSMVCRQEPATTSRSPRSWRGRQWSRPGTPSRRPVTVSQRQRLSEYTFSRYSFILLNR